VDIYNALHLLIVARDLGKQEDVLAWAKHLQLPSSMNSRDGVKLNGLWFIFCAKSIRIGEERGGEGRGGELSCIVW
jgi:hypothetical protein